MVRVSVSCRVMEIARSSYSRWLTDPVTDAGWVAAHRANAFARGGKTTSCACAVSGRRATPAAPSQAIPEIYGRDEPHIRARRRARAQVVSSAWTSEDTVMLTSSTSAGTNQQGTSRTGFLGRLFAGGGQR